MSVDPARYVLDSYALLAHFQDESGRGKMVSLFEQAQLGECRLLLSLINLGEICYLIERRRGLRQAALALSAIDSLPIEVLPADRETVLAAAHLKANYPMAYADAFAAAAAQAHSAILITGDPEFKAVSGLIQIEWLSG